MNKNVNNIRNRLSLRSPQEKSLNILAELVDKLTLKKEPDLGEELSKVRTAFPTCANFERDFPSICFSIATGVGKTRLMGAFITYLYLEKNIKNFFVLAPNLTIYNKLIEDFRNPSHPKYVFKGIGEFVHKPPLIITGDNYNEHKGYENSADFYSPIVINVFNISKINADSRGNNTARIKRLSEYLGDSYFNYLSTRPDLVLLMDESHHYRADRGMQVLNELRPILGLELTATPQVEKKGSAVKFKNVVYEYSLAKAIQDGFVKEPAIATRKDFNPGQYSAEDLDRIKLEDGIRIHEDTKVTLDIYSRDTKTPIIKPFVLVVAQNTDHAGKLKEWITSKDFFGGCYADKVMEIHSNQSGEEKDENICRLVSLESPDNKMEIVIHVNMLKEGWDVTNLYTIIPLRTAASQTLREQTIGRGLRLPFGRRTGVSKVDKLTVVAHDKFQQIIDEANKPDSIIRRENIIEIDPSEVYQFKEAVTSVSILDQNIINEKKQAESLEKPEEKKQALLTVEAKKLLQETLPELNRDVKNISELQKTDIREIVIQKVKEKIRKDPQQNLFAGEIIKQVETVYNTFVDNVIKNIIEIPRIMIQQSLNVRAGFKDFNLEAKNLNYQPVSEEILRKTLREQENAYDTIIGKGGIVIDKPEKIIVNELINFPEIDYDSCSDLLYKLAFQVLEKFKTYLNDEKILNVVQSHKRDIGQYIYTQMMDHFFVEDPGYLKPTVRPFSKIEEHNFSKLTKEKIHDFKDTIAPTNSIPSKVFTGFKKSCHTLYQFDSKAEKDFSIILESDPSAIKWLRPARKQMDIYWKHNSKDYIPDFIVETSDSIYMVEIKAENDLQDAEVQEKARSAIQYCNHATEYTKENNGKPWKYALIPHNAVLINMSFQGLVKQYEQN